LPSLRNMSGEKEFVMQLPEMLQGDSLRRLIQGAIAGSIATIVVGFNWGGWILGGTAAQKVRDVEQSTIVRVLAPICADKFQRSADARTNLEALTKTDSWRRDEMIEKAGWSTFPGSEPDRKVADACAKLLTEVR